MHRFNLLLFTAHALDSFCSSMKCQSDRTMMPSNLNQRCSLINVCAKCDVSVSEAVTGWKGPAGACKAVWDASAMPPTATLILQSVGEVTKGYTTKMLTIDDIPDGSCTIEEHDQLEVRNVEHEITLLPIIPQGVRLSFDLTTELIDDAKLAALRVASLKESFNGASSSCGLAKIANTMVVYPNSLVRLNVLDVSPSDQDYMPPLYFESTEKEKGRIRKIESLPYDYPVMVLCYRQYCKGPDYRFLRAPNPKIPNPPRTSVSAAAFAALQAMDEMNQPILREKFLQKQQEETESDSEDE